MKLDDLLKLMVANDASDLHIKAGSPPGIRIHGKLVPIEGTEMLTAEMTSLLIDELLDDQRRQRFEENRELDFSKHLAGVARFRINVFHQRNSEAAVLRQIPIETPVLENMGFPEIVKKLCLKPRGLVLVTGPTGSGKSTTLASMIDFINRTEHGHILTLEDPIEFIHKDKNCYVNQREMSADSHCFGNALRAALREDPDIILVGEMRDLETIGLAVTAAETGHLVFGTLHTTSAIQTVDRIIDVFPHEAQQQIRTQLSNTIQGVISQTLLPKIGGGRACAQEIMTGTDGIRNLIREGKTAQLLNFLQTGSQHGMQTLESHLEKLVLEGIITTQVAIGKANSPLPLIQSLRKAGIKLTEEDPTQPATPTQRQKPSTEVLAQRLAQATGLKANQAPAPAPAPAPQEARAPQEPVKQAAGGGAHDDFEQFRAMRKKK